MLIFAHRGASGYAPENTIKSMQLALKMGAKAVELDVQLVEDELVVFHDRWLNGKTNGSGLIADKQLSELAQIRIEDQPIPSLWDVLANFDDKPLVNIELKGDNTVNALIKLYPKIIAELGYSNEELLISSFNHHYLSHFKQAHPQANIAPLVEGIPLDLAAVGKKLNAYSIHLNVNFINQEIIDDAHQHGLKVYVYTVDHAEDIRRLKQLGVDGIFSNFPDKANQIANN